MAAKRCKNCGRKIWYRPKVYDGYGLLYEAEWVHRKTNGLHCPYTYNTIELWDHDKEN